MASQRLSVRFLCSVALSLTIFGGRAHAQLITGDESIFAKFNPFHSSEEPRQLDVPELCHQLDCLSEKLRDDGLVVVKQPDVLARLE